MLLEQLLKHSGNSNQGFMDKHIEDINQVIRIILQKIHLWSPEAQQLILATGAAESGYRNLIQTGGGPALSYWQIEPDTAIDNLKSWLKFRPKILYSIAKGLGINAGHLENPKREDVEFYLLTSMAYAIMHCRLKYLRFPEPLPAVNDRWEQCKQWVRYYNAGGKGSEKHFMDSYAIIKKGSKNV